MQAVLETEIGEHDALKSATRTACEALEVEGVQSGSSLGSRLVALSGRMRERLRGALHTGVKRALAVIASHYIGVDLQGLVGGTGSALQRVVLPDLGLEHCLHCDGGLGYPGDLLQPYAKIDGMGLSTKENKPNRGASL